MVQLNLAASFFEHCNEPSVSMEGLELRSIEMVT